MTRLRITFELHLIATNADGADWYADVSRDELIYVLNQFRTTWDEFTVEDFDNSDRFSAMRSIARDELPEMYRVRFWLRGHYNCEGQSGQKLSITQFVNEKVNVSINSCKEVIFVENAI